MREQLERIIANSNSRFEIWEQFCTEQKITQAAEIGVYRGEFAAGLLKAVPSIEQYTMIDSWRNLGDWNMPLNADQETFESWYNETMERTDFAKEKRVVLRGTTQEVVDQVPDQSLDYIYIDGDHTLRGITIDLIKWYPKVKPGGFITGDDFGKNIFQHPLRFEPIPIFPWAVHFAEAMDVPMYGLPGQFLLHKDTTAGYAFHDLTDGDYADLSLRSQVVRNPLWYAKKQYLSPIYQKLKALLR